MHSTAFYRRCLLSGLIFLLGAIHAGAAAPAGRLSDEQIVAQGQLAASSAHFELYQDRVKVDPSFLQIMESAYGEIQSITGLRLDTATLGPIVRIYVSNQVRISHVWRGYDHPGDPRGMIFLNPRVYREAMGGQNATHIHELTHLFTWRFNSHTLREGIADYVALKILPGAAVGPNPPSGEAPPYIAPEIYQYLGTTKPPPDWVSIDRVRRAAYYFASYRFVKYLVESKGMGTFLKLYASENPESDIQTLYAMTREEAIQAALR